MGNDRIVQRVYVGECMGRQLVGQIGKRGIDPANNCLKSQKVSMWWKGCIIEMNGRDL